MHPEDLRRPQLNVSNENVRMLCPCFTPIKSLHGLPGNLQRTAWNLARTSRLSPFRVPTDRNDFYLNSERYSNSGVRTENRVRPDSHRFDRGRIRPDCSLPLQGLGLRPIGQYQLFQQQLPLKHLNAQGPGIQRNRAKTGSRAEEGLEWPDAQLRAEPEGSLDSRVTEAGQRAKQRVTGHGARVIIAALIFVPGVANPAVIAAAQSLNDGQSLFDEPFCDEMRGHLVFDAGPDFVGVDKRQRGLAAAGPSAQQQAGFVAHGVAGTLSVGVLAEVGFEIVLEDSLQCLPNFILSKRSIDSVDARHPSANDSVGEASLSILIFWPFAFQELLHFAAAVIHLSNHGGKGGIPQSLVLHLLLEILAIEELLFHKARTSMGQF